ncbi:glycosyltransferase family 2 protein [Hyphococcus lacteus]|uniref:Glycosyltransferase family 2 protein n=1 Tax=Hyphococcus lacteus TaxID=3143536 RepID=A0ABV3Z144_9PROT
MEADHSSPLVTVIIVNYNAGDRLRRCLEHLAAQVFRNFDIIVVDNASDDDSLAVATASDIKFTLIEAGDNLGFAAANNLAAKSARGRWLAFLNPDAYAEPNWLTAFVAGQRRFPVVEAFGSTQIDDHDHDRLDGAGDVCSVYGIAYRGFFGWPRKKRPQDSGCFAACAAAAFYRRDVFEALGGFDERFFCYGEDVDLGFRLLLSGGETVQLHDAVVHHEGSGVTGRNSEFSVYHGHRNRIWLYYKNTPAVLYWLTVPIRGIGDLLLLGKALLSGTSGAYFNAIKDGYGNLAQFRDDRAILSVQKKSAYIAARMVWSPFALLRRQGKTIPIKERSQSEKSCTI